MARRPHDASRRGHQPGDRASLWTRRVPAPAGQSLLVPVLRRGHGHGLAFVRHHHQRHRRAQARADAAAKASSAFMSAAAAASIRARRRRSWSRSAIASGFDGAALAQASRLVAKVDSAAVQDGFDLYLHGFIVTDDGKWTVVQQGMNGDASRRAAITGFRKVLQSFVEEPHAAIDGPGQGEIVNLADRRADDVAHGAARAAFVVRARRDRARIRSAGRARARAGRAGATVAAAPDHAGAPRRAGERRRHAPPARQSRRGGRSRADGFPRLLLTPGVGARTVQRSGHGGRGRAWRAVPLHAIRRGSRLRTAARTGIRSRCRSRSMTRRSVS